MSNLVICSCDATDAVLTCIGLGRRNVAFGLTDPSQSEKSLAVRYLRFEPHPLSGGGTKHESAQNSFCGHRDSSQNRVRGAAALPQNSLLTARSTPAPKQSGARLRLAQFTQFFREVILRDVESLNPRHRAKGPLQ
jgi:hypothetical protein